MNPSIEELNLSHNMLTDKTLTEFEEWLQKDEIQGSNNLMLQRIDISENNFTDLKLSEFLNILSSMQNFMKLHSLKL